MGIRTHFGVLSATNGNWINNGRLFVTIQSAALREKNFIAGGNAAAHSNRLKLSYF
jgi:hypothetical protein